MISLVLAAALFAAGEPAAAQATTEAPKAAADKGPKPDKNGMICVKEAVSGSKMKTRICMTQAEWDQRKATDREMIDQAQRNRPLTGN
jgi:predicted secreted protein